MSKNKKLKTASIFYKSLFLILLLLEMVLLAMCIRHNNVIRIVSFITILLVIVFIKILNIDEKLKYFNDINPTKIV